MGRGVGCGGEWGQGGDGGGCFCLLHAGRPLGTRGARAPRVPQRPRRIFVRVSACIFASGSLCTTVAVSVRVRRLRQDARPSRERAAGQTGRRDGHDRRRASALQRRQVKPGPARPSTTPRRAISRTWLLAGPVAQLAARGSGRRRGGDCERACRRARAWEAAEGAARPETGTPSRGGLLQIVPVTDAAT